MARSLNKAILIGNLGADPEVRTTGGGVQVAQFSIATSRAWSDAEGTAQERTEWHRVVVWGKLVEVVERYLRKGDRVYVEGEIQYRSYDDSEGITRHVTEIRARDLLMLGGRPEESAPAPEPIKKAARRKAAVPAGVGARDDDDLPF